jgi:NNP family nitrate/nitrite transporter-like MFS transporter
MVWSVVVAKCLQLSWTSPLVNGFARGIARSVRRCLRIFYSFAGPVRWTVVDATASHLPAIGNGFVVQNPDTTYLTFPDPSLDAGFGGGGELRWRTSPISTQKQTYKAYWGL